MFIRQIMEDFTDPAINEIVVMCSAQSAKTLTMLAIVAYLICNDPGPLLWVCHNLTEAKRLSKTRLYPMLERCAPTAEKLPTSRELKKTLECYLPGMFLAITGAEATGSLQSTPYKYVICDEARSYKRGVLGMISKRFRSYGAVYKKIVISTPDEENDELDMAWKAGDQRRLVTRCPKCGHGNDLSDWGNDRSPGGMKWDKNSETYDVQAEDWKWDELYKTIRYECWNPECDHSWREMLSDRKYISRSDEWEAHNPNAPSNVRSYTWGATVPYWPEWRQLVREYLEALKALEWGDPAPLKDHITETRGQVWTSPDHYIKGDRSIEDRTFKYDPHEPWDREIKRFLTIDVQGKGGRHFKWVVRAWGPKAQSRKLAHGVAYTFEELQEIEREWKVPPVCTGIDSGTFTSEVYAYVVKSGYRWKALKGDDRWSFKEDGRQLLYSMTEADPGIGTEKQGKVPKIRLRVWAKYGALDRLLAMMGGVIGDWQVAPDHDGRVDREYVLEVTAQQRRTVRRGNGRSYTEFYNTRPDDHFSDCEQMQVVMAAAADVLTPPPPQGKGRRDQSKKQEDEHDSED